MWYSGCFCWPDTECESDYLYNKSSSSCETHGRQPKFPPLIKLHILHNSEVSFDLKEVIEVW